MILCKRLPAGSIVKAIKPTKFARIKMYNTYKPKNRNWEWNRSKHYASYNLNSPIAPKAKAKMARKVARKATSNVTIENVAGTTLESLGLNFSPVAVRKPTIVG